MQQYNDKNAIMIDDDPDTLESFGEMLKYLFNEVHLFKNPLDAIQFLKECQNSIDIIISDMNMPYMNGRDFLSHIRDMNIDSAFMFITADQNLYANELATVSYLKKPIDLALFHHELASIFKSR